MTRKDWDAYREPWDVTSLERRLEGFLARANQCEEYGSYSEALRFAQKAIELFHSSSFTSQLEWQYRCWLIARLTLLRANVMARQATQLTDQLIDAYFWAMLYADLVKSDDGAIRRRARRLFAVVCAHFGYPAIANAYYEQALGHLTPDELLEGWAKSTLQWAIVLIELGRIDRAIELLNAISGLVFGANSRVQPIHCEAAARLAYLLWQTRSYGRNSRRLANKFRRSALAHARRLDPKRSNQLCMHAHVLGLRGFRLYGVWCRRQRNGPLVL